MKGLANRFTFYVSIVIYLLFNLRLKVNDIGTIEQPVDFTVVWLIIQNINVVATLQATAWQLVKTVPYVAGITYFLIAVLQYMSGGEKLPWDRRLRIFLAIGIVAGLVYAIWVYSGAKA